MGAFYTVTAAVTPGAAINYLIELKAVKAFWVLGVEITQATTTAATDLAWEFGIATGTASGWTTSSITPYDSGHSGSAASTTVKAYSSGTSVDGTGLTAVRQYGLDIRAGQFYLPIPEGRLEVPINDYFVIKPLTTPPGSTAFYINVDIRELG